jgi:aspartate kinase
MEESMIKELKSKYHQVTVMPCSLVCAIGTSVTKPGIVAKAAKALADRNINIYAVSQSLMQVNIQFVISRESYRQAVIALNDALCYRG